MKDFFAPFAIVLLIFGNACIICVCSVNPWWRIEAVRGAAHSTLHSIEWYVTLTENGVPAVCGSGRILVTQRISIAKRDAINRAHSSIVRRLRRQQYGDSLHQTYTICIEWHIEPHFHKNPSCHWLHYGATIYIEVRIRNLRGRRALPKYTYTGSTFFFFFFSSNRHAISSQNSNWTSAVWIWILSLLINVHIQ